MKERVAKLVVKDAEGELLQILPEVKTNGYIDPSSDVPVSGKAVAKWGSRLRASIESQIEGSQSGSGYKGSKETVAALNAVSSPSTGDIWKVEETNAFYVWDGENWSVLSSASDISFQYSPASSRTSSSAYTAEAVGYDGTIDFGVKLAIDGTYILGGEYLTEARQYDVSEIQSFPVTISSGAFNANSVIALEFHISQGSDDFWATYTLNESFSDLLAAGSAGMPMTEDSSEAYEGFHLLEPNGKTLYVSCTDNNNGTYTFYPFIVATVSVPESAVLTLENADGSSGTADIISVRSGLVKDVSFSRPSDVLVGLMLLDTDQFAVAYPNTSADYSETITYYRSWGMRFKDYTFGFDRSPLTVISGGLASLPQSFQLMAAFIGNPSASADEDKYISCIVRDGDSITDDEVDAAIQANGKFIAVDTFHHSGVTYGTTTLTITKPSTNYVMTVAIEFADVVQNVLNETLTYADGSTETKSVLLRDIAPAAHSHDAGDIRLEGYQKPSSTSPVASGDTVGEAIGKIEKALDSAGGGVYFAVPNESASTASLTATVSGITEYFTGLAIALRMPFNSVANQTLNVNGLGAKPIYYQSNTTTAGIFPSGCLVLLVYETASLAAGCFKAVYSYNSDTHYTTKLYAAASSGATSNATSDTGNSATYLVVCDNTTSRGGIQITGTGGTTVSANSGTLTISSPEMPQVRTYSALGNGDIDTVFSNDVLIDKTMTVPSRGGVLGYEIFAPTGGSGGVDGGPNRLIERLEDDMEIHTNTDYVYELTGWSYEELEDLTGISFRLYAVDENSNSHDYTIAGSSISGCSSSAYSTWSVALANAAYYEESIDDYVFWNTVPFDASPLADVGGTVTYYLNCEEDNGTPTLIYSGSEWNNWFYGEADNNVDTKESFKFTIENVGGRFTITFRWICIESHDH